MDNNVEYYITLDDVQYGPYDAATVRGMNLPHNCLVMSSYSNCWRPLGDYPEIAVHDGMAAGLDGHFTPPPFKCL